MVGAAIEAVSAQLSADPAAIVQSQETQAGALAATWLSSTNARTRAWGAYLALRDQRRELLPRLIALAQAYAVKDGQRTSTEESDHAAMVGVLDAVIQLGGGAPAEAATLYPEFPAQSIILLARAGRSSANFLLDIFRRENRRTNEWLASGNLLMALKPPGFAATVLGSFTVTAQVRVVDNGTGVASGIGRVGGRACSSIRGGPSPSASWPPVGNYSTRRYYGNDVVERIDGSTPVFVVRSVGAADTDERIDPCDGILEMNRDVFREHILAGLAADPTGNPTVRSAVAATVTWQDSTQYLQALRAVIERQQGSFDTLRKNLMDAGLLSAEEGASSRPSLEVRIIDARSNTAFALPVLHNAGSQVKITNPGTAPPR